jgi:predicted MFS family arabinose efflux permease
MRRTLLFLTTMTTAVLLASRVALAYEASWLGKACTRSTRSTLTLGLLLMVATLLMMFFMDAKPAHAISTFTVNSALDGSDGRGHKR